MVPYQIPLLLIALAVLTKVSCIMVPTGKIGPITPAKPMAIVFNPSANRQPPAVWEIVNESDSPYKPPIYKYVLYDYVMKYGHHTLIPREEDYYYPTPKMRPTKTPYYGSKNKFYYSPLQFL